MVTVVNRYLMYVDDMAPKDTSTFNVFEQRFLSGQPQLNPVLDALVKVLMHMWDIFDPICANSIAAATFEFVTSSCLEPELERLPLVRGIQRFSWFLRARTGVAIPFSLFNFPKSTRLGLMEYIQAMADMDFWASITNDLISSVFLSLPSESVNLKPMPKISARFHKEEVAGETGNYVHNRAQMENKTPLQVLSEMAEELRISRVSIHKILSHNPNALRVWKAFERGYV